jgi:hypothetical protein
MLEMCEEADESVTAPDISRIVHNKHSRQTFIVVYYNFKLAIIDPEFFVNHPAR